MALVLRLVKGSRLTKAEGDDNLTYLFSLITALQTALPAAARGIVDISRSGSNLVITFTDASESTVPIPTLQVNFRQTWQPSTEYAVNDFFTINGAVYVVLHDHTSDLTFDPNASESASNLYFQLLENPAAEIATGGAAGDFYRKTGSGDFAADWETADLSALSDVELASDLSEGDILVLRSGVWVNEQLTLPAPASGSDATLGGVFAEPGEANKFAYGIDEDGNLLLVQPAFTDIAGAVAAAQLPMPTTSALGGVEAIDAVAHQWISEIGTDGVPVLTQPDFPDISGNLAATQMPNVATALGTTGTISLDPTLGTVFTVTPTGTITLNAASAPAGALVVLIVTTSGTSSFNITPTTNFKSIGALATGTSSGKKFTMTFMGDGTTMYEVARTAAM